MLGSFLGYVGRWLDMAICMVISAVILLVMYPVTLLVGTGQFLWGLFRPTPPEKWDGVDRRKQKRKE